MMAWSPYKAQQWCAFIHPEHGKCAFGLGHRIEYHYCGGVQLSLNGRPLTPEEYSRITADGTR